MTKVTIRQRPTEAAKYFGLDRLDLAVHPAARQSVYARKDRDERTFVTGLNENAIAITSIADKSERAKKQKEVAELRKRLESQLGVDLGPHSDFWIGFEIDLVIPGMGDLTWDLDNATDHIKYLVAVAGRFVAPNVEVLSEPEYLNTFLYVHNPTEHTSRRVQLQELRDDVGAQLSLIKKQREKLFYLASALSLPVNPHMDRETLYMLLSTYRDTMKSVEDWEGLLAILNRDNATLQIQYVVETAMRRHKFSKESGQWTYKGQPLGATRLEVIDELSTADMRDVLAMLLEEFLPNWG